MRKSLQFLFYFLLPYQFIKIQTKETLVSLKNSYNYQFRI